MKNFKHIIWIAEVNLYVGRSKALGWKRLFIRVEIITQTGKFKEEICLRVKRLDKIGYQQLYPTHTKMTSLGCCPLYKIKIH